MEPIRTFSEYINETYYGYSNWGDEPRSIFSQLMVSFEGDRRFVVDPVMLDNPLFSDKKPLFKTAARRRLIDLSMGQISNVDEAEGMFAFTTDDTTLFRSHGISAILVKVEVKDDKYVIAVMPAVALNLKQNNKIYLPHPPGRDLPRFCENMSSKLCPAGHFNSGPLRTFVDKFIFANTKAFTLQHGMEVEIDYDDVCCLIIGKDNVYIVDASSSYEGVTSGLRYVLDHVTDWGSEDDTTVSYLSFDVGTINLKYVRKFVDFCLGR